MKNTRNYRLTAILLAVIMIIGILPAAEADFTLGGTYMYNATSDAIISFASDGQSVNNVTDLVPNKNSTMTVSVPGSDALPKNSSGETIVTVPENVTVTSENAAACNSDTVSCTYRPGKNLLVFKWIGTAHPEEGFTATLPITPDVPATIDVSGRHVIVTVMGNQSFVGALKAQTRSNNRLVASLVTIYEGKLVFDNNSDYIWTFNHLSGDWYTISNGSYLKMEGNSLTLTDKANATVFHISSEENGLVIESNGYYLNTKGDKAENGMQGSNWAPRGQWIKLYSPSDLFASSADDNNGYVKLSANGGNASIASDILSAQAGTTVTLPNYTGTKSGKQFIGWAKYSNIYENHDGNDSSYCEVYLPGSSFTVTNGITNLYAVYNEKQLDARFGIRKDGTIPHEPGNHPANEYQNYHYTITDGVKIGRWVVDVDGNGVIEGNHIVNSVTGNLRDLPSDEEIKKMDKSYDPETMYVHWYVLKYSGNQWKIDGVIRTREGKSIGYDVNLTNSDRSKIKNMPDGFEYGKKATIMVGAESKNGKAKIPSLEGYEFLGWNTKADGTGTSYESGATIEVSENITFYAQWRAIPKYEVSYTLNNAAKNAEVPQTVAYQESNIVELPEAEERDGYIFSGWYVNGEQIDGNTFEMPAEPVEVTGTYYGPIDVIIYSNWPNGEPGFPGARIVLRAVADCDENLDYDFQWFYKNGDEWIEIPGATSDTITYELDEETSGRIWRVVVTNVRPHQD